ncbi:YqaJ viral recombinase family protein [Rhodococcus sp. ACS1]|uniref:YqaJ viral recombinase family nuclease n=1 Tax=Rhodococcus sp. ACS1 TaxID=2028570 RepID=UPI0015C7F959|nr:YqaJ viral recombinase family protein [Rhodococcus sp. ACS1]
MEPLVNNSAVLVGTFTSGSDEWHAARAKGIGGSEISAIVGLNEYESRFSCYYRKLEKLRPVAESDPMKWGTLLEPIIFAEFMESYVVPRGLHMTTGDTFHHKDRPWQIANPDGLIWNNGELIDLLEIKTAGRDDKWGPRGTDLIPIAYRCQMAWYMDVMGIESGLLRVLIGGNDARTYRITPTREDIEYLRSEGEQFMHDLENHVEPNLDDHTATYNAIKEMHPLIDGSVVQISSELADRWWAVQDAYEEVSDARQGVLNELAMTMGLARVAMCGDEKVAFRQKPRTEGKEPFVKSAPRPKFSTAIAA